MSNKDNVKRVGGENIRETREMDRVTETLENGMEGDSDTGECIMKIVPSTTNKEEDGGDGDVMEKLWKVTSKKQIQVYASMIPFFVLLSESSEWQDDGGKPRKALEVHCFPVNINPINGKWIYELMNHAANHPLKLDSGNFLSTMGEDTVALQIHRPDNKVSKQIPHVISPT